VAQPFPPVVRHLAGRELVVPGRDKIITAALAEHYGVTCFGADAELRAKERFHALWTALAGSAPTDADRLIEAVRVEIWEHVAFWDDVYYALLEMPAEFAS
jgi:hypothetical protein